jgi:hypothetical protein
MVEAARDLPSRVLNSRGHRFLNFNFDKYR